MTSAGPERPRILRIIARLNVGGPAIQAITLTRRLEDRGFETTLVRGVEGPDEGNMDHLAGELGVAPVLVASLRRDPSWRDLPALWTLVRILRRERPHIVHTHAAKAGTLGRLATLLATAPWRRPVLVHTFHGHSLTGYFAPRTAAVFRRIERVLARRTDRLIAVSDEVRDELVAMRVAPREKFEVVPLGFDLTPFVLEDGARAGARVTLREELGIPQEAHVVTLIARLVAIKRVDRFLAVAGLLCDLPRVHFLIVGDGELRDELRTSAAAQSLGERLTWAGFRRDVAAVCAASDVVVLTSDNEGTPVSLIEAQAAGVPVVCTDVGGATSVVGHGETGFVIGRDDEIAFAGAIRALYDDPALGRRFAAAGRRRARERFDLDRLIADLTALYRSQLERQPRAIGPLVRSPSGA